VNHVKKLIQQFESYSTFPQIKMAAAHILEGPKIVLFNKTVKKCLLKANCSHILWKSVKCFKKYSALSIHKMAVAAILDFVTMSYWTNLSNNRPTSPMLLSRQIWWKSVEWFKSYSTLSSFKMGSSQLEFCRLTINVLWFIFDSCTLTEFQI
jgi:hypothetical protein